MHDVIHDIQSRSDDDTNILQKSTTSNHLDDAQVSNSIHPMNEPNTVDPNASTPQPSALSTQQTETPTDDADQHGTQSIPASATAPVDAPAYQNQSEQEKNLLNGDYIETKTNVDDDQRPSSATKQNGLDETTGFATTTKSSNSRIQSASSKQSIHVISDEVSSVFKLTNALLYLAN